MTTIRKATDLSGGPWRKSSYSGGNEGQCVEVKDARETSFNGIGIRDSKYPDGAALLVSPAAFASFVADAASGCFDR
ncbi:DUF397 domain-containing protein [Streptomyces sp. NPDC001118]